MATYRNNEDIPAIVSPTFVSSYLQTFGVFERGQAEPRGGPNLEGVGLLGPLTSVQDATALAFNSIGSQFSQATTAGAGNSAYTYTSAPSGPMASEAGWDLIYRLEFGTVDNDLRFGIGTYLTGVAITNAWAADAPVNEHAMIFKQTGAAAAYLSVRGAGGITQTAFATWVPATSTAYWMAISKRAAVVVANVYTSAGVLIDTQTVTQALTAATSHSVVAGINNIAAAVRHIKHYGWYVQQIPATMTGY